ncbi:monosaccharide ABC transporter substrate-binding protein (CUT2 family) [Williamsia limnetica]|uniref:Monosaccharide ABC transporter substrate-binding protein (CUT2 family) n=1 Tax=Williamsia limnetica TaxID=882452 RepID=A0A318R9Y6_WILLI|nr:substrate-binding domain-containing protein [Williamsia limnetica]PYE12468.1 monosaccharide ABC transporter substrate-binding protein (CUT2 family) [Williamsia limnetica]
MRWKTSTMGVMALATATAVLVGACSSDDGGSGGGGGGTTSPETIATAKENVTKFSALDQKFPMPTEPVTPGTGTVAILGGGFTAPIHAEQAKNAQVAAGVMGWNVLGPFDGKFSPAVQGGYVDQAVQAKATGVVMIAVDVSAIKGSIDRALTAGVKVACVMCDSGQEYRDKGVIDVAVNFQTQGEYMGWYLIASSEGKSKILSTVEPAAPQTVKRAEGLKSVIDTNCPGCSVESLTIPSADSVLPGPPQWSSFLTANAGSVTDAVAYYDGLAKPMFDTLTQTGVEGITVNGYDADTSTVEILRSGKGGFGATVGEPYEFATWGALDQIARSKAGLPLWESSDLPSVLITADNAEQYTPYLAPAGDWQAQFTTLWGKG